MPDAATPPSAAMRALARRAKFARARLTVLVPTDGYHVQQESLRALTALGHRAIPVPLPANPERATGALEAILKAASVHRPDLLVSINYLGFDRAGWLGELIEQIQLPTAVWFVDSPLFFAMGYLPPSRTMTRFFSWDRSHQNFLQGLGAGPVHYLPLATEPERLVAPADERGGAQLPLGFVGSSMVSLSKMWRDRLDATEAQQAQRQGDLMRADRNALHRLVADPRPPIDRRVLVAAYANCVGSRQLRRELLAALPQQELFVFGDEDWRRELPRAKHPGPVGYGAPLAQVFRRSTINLNATILQMPTGVNQRVFDCPSAGGFLLTDAQGDLPALLTPGEEIITYQSQEELVDLVRYWRRRDSERRAIVARAQRRIAAEHTYRHRLQALCAAMRAAFA